MPIYTWTCSKCGCQVDLLRTMDDYRKAPTDEEVPATPECEKHEWDKTHHPFRMVRGAGWSGKKGEW